MKKPALNISYWTRSDGDFTDIEEFKNALKENYEVELMRKTSDALGGGLYELAIQVYNDLTLREFLQSYVEDAVKWALVFFAKDIFQAVKQLFGKNEKHKPGIQSVTIKFRDAEIVFYSLYPNNIAENIESTAKAFLDHSSMLAKGVSSKIMSVHIPIFFHTEKVGAQSNHKREAFEITAYRVRLRVDETITNFSADDYKKLWGIRCENSDYVYEVASQRMVEARFFLEEEYWKLWKESYDKSKIADKGLT